MNGAYDNKDDTSELVHDFRCKRAEEMFTQALADKTRYLKDSPEGVSEMCKAIEDMRKEHAKEIAWQLLTMNMGTPEQISQATGLTLEEVQELAKEVQAPV